MAHFSGIVLIALLLTGISGIILPYFWYLFWRLRRHFLISAKFPYWTLSISFILYILGVVGTVALFTLNIYDFDKDKTRSRTIAYPIQIIAGQIGSYCLCTAVIYRAFKFYIKWDSQELTLQIQTTIIHKVFNSKSEQLTIDAMMDNQKQNPHKIMKCVVTSTLIIGFILLSATLPSVLNIKELEILRNLLTVPYLMVFILGAIVLFKGRKMKESILCKRETYMVAILIIVNAALDAVPVSISVKLLISLILCMFYVLYIVYVRESVSILHICMRLMRLITKIVSHIVVILDCWIVIVYGKEKYGEIKS